MRHKVLVVDDDAGELIATGDLLEDEYDVLLAGPQTPYQTALQLWEENPDLLIALVDLNMPGPTGEAGVDVGFSLIRELKNKRQDARIAVHSAYQDHANLAEAALSEADGFIGKTWEPEAILANIELFTDWVRVVSALYRSIELRDPYTAGHTTRVRDYCQSLIAHLQDASPKIDDPHGFDLAACLVAAELHDLGKLEMPDDILIGDDAGLTSEQRQVIEQHVNAAKGLKLLGPGFKKIADIAYQHHRRYLDPGDAPLTDYPKDDELPREDDIPFEARVLHVADVLDALLSDRSYRPGMPLERAMEIIAEETAEGNFDPKVSNALERLINVDPDRVNDIAAEGRIRDDLRLYLYFHDKRLTAGRLHTLLSMLSDVYLAKGKAMDRLAIKGVEASGVGRDASVIVKLAGTADDVNETQRILTARMEEDKKFQPSREQPDTVIRGLRPVPFKVRTRKI